MPRKILLHCAGKDFFMAKSKCSEKPPRKGPMTVKVKEYTKKDGTKVDSHKRHTPKK